MRIVVLGGGYAGVMAAKRLARQVCRHDIAVTLVNAAPNFVERPRLHQVAAGEQVPSVPLAELLAGSGAELLVGWVEAIDTDRRQLRFDDARTLSYDILVYAVGSLTNTETVPGIAAHAWTLSDPANADRLARQLTEIAHTNGRVVVCGGGLTGIEAATEFAEAHPDLTVELVSRDEPGHWLSTNGQTYLRRALDRLGIPVRAGAAVTEIRAGELVLADHTSVPFDACVWTGGFTVPALARDSGLQVNAEGRVLVDTTLRSVSHPDVYAIGDAAAAAGGWGESMAYGCRTGGFMGPYVADAIADTLAGRTPRPFRFRYIHQCVSLGRKDALIQFVEPTTETPRGAQLTGRIAVRYKEIVLSGAIWTFRHPGPYLPRRRRPVAVTAPAPVPVSTGR